MGIIKISLSPADQAILGIVNPYTWKGSLYTHRYCDFYIKCILTTSSLSAILASLLEDKGRNNGTLKKKSFIQLA